MWLRIHQAPAPISPRTLVNATSATTITVFSSMKGLVPLCWLVLPPRRRVSDPHALPGL